MAKPTDKKYYLGKISLFFAMKSALDQMIIKRHLAVPKFSRYERKKTLIVFHRSFHNS